MSSQQCHEASSESDLLVPGLVETFQAGREAASTSDSCPGQRVQTQSNHRLLTVAGCPYSPSHPPPSPPHLVPGLPESQVSHNHLELQRTLVLWLELSTGETLFKIHDLSHQGSETDQT